MKRIMAMILCTTMLFGATACTKSKMEELTSSDCWIVAYTKNPNNEYSAFMSQSVHFAVTKDSGKNFEELYLGNGKLYATCDFNEENGIVSKGLHNIEIYRLGDEYIITASETKRTKLADGNYPVEAKAMQCGCKVVRLDGQDIVPLLKAVLELFPLDKTHFVKPIERHIQGDIKRLRHLLVKALAVLLL